jgi:hypothetical protein
VLPFDIIPFHHEVSTNTDIIVVGKKRELLACGWVDAKMASNPPRREDFMIQQHGKLLQIHHRLKTMVEEQGDHAFATALGSCVATARGENAGADTCPFRQLLLEDYVKTGVAPLEATTSDQSSVPLSQGHSSAALPHDVVLSRIKMLLRQDARRLDDQRYLQALADCEEATKSNPQCPFFQLRASEAKTK